MACDPNTLIAEAQCLLKCIPPGMMGPVQMALLCQIAENGGGGGGGLYVLKAGDTMTGPLIMAQAVLVASAPAIDIAQTWNNAAVVFSAFRIAVTATAQNAASRYINVLKDGNDFALLDNLARWHIFRQTADNSSGNMTLFKRGTVGDINAAVAADANLGFFTVRGWNGASYHSDGSGISMFAEEAFTAIAGGTRIEMRVVPNGSTSAGAYAVLRSSSFNIQSGCAYQLNGVALFNPRTVYAAGTAYTLTATSAAVDFGTTDPIITINAAGTYAIRARVKVNLNAATFAANQTLTVKLRRTNNTAADVSQSSTTWTVPIITLITQTLAVIELPEVFYTTALTTDTIQLFADISVLPSAGTISIDEASIVAIRTS